MKSAIILAVVAVILACTVILSASLQVMACAWRRFGSRGAPARRRPVGAVCAEVVTLDG
ncbi:hypothetical protein AB0878_32350 [Amycolatopsis sp. NPDC047767]|uniref:hypothetical protein n=1 Tax=Amycolatopsis sp. NPDC047767 TaxID=3156765 RepID=UPI0034536A80